MERYSKILEICKQFSAQILPKSKVGRPSKLSDIEILALSLYQEEMGYASEREFYISLCERAPEMAKKLGSRRNYNTRRRNVAWLCEEMRKRILRALHPANEAVYVVDSMPLPICRQARCKSCKTMRGVERSEPQSGYCAAQHEFYFGYKFHAVCSPEGIIMAYDIAPANLHDNGFLADVKARFHNCILLGDKGYRSTQKQYELFEYAGIELHVPYKYNETARVDYPAHWARIRKRIEVVFSQLVQHWQIRRNFATSQQGFYTRVIAKVTSFTLAQYVNLQHSRPLGRTKHALASLKSA